jgi:membrane-associated protease RseP (regulator of RpoE activity)
VPEERPVPGRRWFRLAILLVVLVLLAVGGVVASQLLGSDGTRNTGTPAAPRSSAAASPTARPVTGTTATDFDPFGDPPAENSDLVGRAVDGDPATSWRTSTYEQDLGPGGIKSGVGLVVDLRRVHRVAEVDLTFARPGTHVSLYVAPQAPTSANDLGDPVATVTAGRTSRVVLDRPATGRFVTVWLTSLPQVQGGFRSELAEVSVLGARA